MNVYAVLIAQNYPVPCSAEVYESVTAAIDEECARIAGCGCHDFVTDAELISSRACSPDGLSRWVVVTDKGDTQGDLHP